MKNMTTASNEKQRNAARVKGYTIHGPEDVGYGWAFCINGSYSKDYPSESAAWDAAVWDMDSDRFWQDVVPYFGLDQSFDYNANPDLMRQYLAIYDEGKLFLLNVDSASETLIGILDVSGNLESESIQRAAYQLRLTVAKALGDHERAKVAQESLDELTA
jgi:hypothetical protein